MKVCYLENHIVLYIFWTMGGGAIFSDDIKMVALGDLERYLLQFLTTIQLGIDNWENKILI